MIKLIGILLVVFGIVLVVIMSILAQQSNNVHWSKKLLYRSPILLVVFGMATCTVRHQQLKDEQMDNLKISVVCGQVLHYHNYNPKNVTPTRVGGGGEGTNITLDIAGEKKIYDFPKGIPQIQVGERACFKIQDGSKTKGAYQNKIIALVENQ